MNVIGGMKMTNEEFQNIVLEKLEKLEGDVGGLKDSQRKLEDGQRKLEDGQRKLEDGQREIRKELNYVWDDIKRIESRLEKQEIKIRKIAP